MIHTMNWDDVRFFLAVARGGSIRRAASLLGVNHGTVSRRIRQLESYHGRQLFEPSPSGFTLTSTGEDVYELASEIELDMAALSQRMSGRDVEIRGTVRISIGDNFTAQLAPIFAQTAEFIHTTRAAGALSPPLLCGWSVPGLTRSVPEQTLMFWQVAQCMFTAQRGSRARRRSRQRI